MAVLGTPKTRDGLLHGISGRPIERHRVDDRRHYDTLPHELSDGVGEHEEVWDRL